MAKNNPTGTKKITNMKKKTDNNPTPKELFIEYTNNAITTGVMAEKYGMTKDKMFELLEQGEKEFDAAPEPAVVVNDLPGKCYVGKLRVEVSTNNSHHTDILPVDAKDTTRLFFSPSRHPDTVATANELVKRWNAYTELVEALGKIAEMKTGNENKPDWMVASHAIETARAALDKHTKQ